MRLGTRLPDAPLLPLQRRRAPPGHSRSPPPPREKHRPLSPHPTPIPWRSSGGLQGRRNREHVQHDTFIYSKVQDIHVYD